MASGLLLVFLLSAVLPQGSIGVNKPTKHIHPMQMMLKGELQHRKEQIISKIRDPTCLKHIRALIDGVREREYWALNMVDASMKISDGLLFFATWYVGNYEQCLRIQNVKTDSGSFSGQHCMARFCTADGECVERMSDTIKKGIPLMEQIETGHIGEDLIAKAKVAVNTSSVHIGFCMPSTCNSSDLENLLNAAISQVTKEVHTNVHPEDCHTTKAPDFEVIDYVTLGLFSAILALIICSTLYDVTHQDASNCSELYIVFSAYTNLKKLMSTSETNNNKNLGCLHGIRFFSIAYVILGHTYVNYALIPLHNPKMPDEFMQSWNSIWVMTGVFSVDTFFLLSGLLLCYIFFNVMTERKSINYRTFYMHRFIRLTPTLVAVLLIHVSLAKRLNIGPMWNEVFLEDCSDVWWQVLLYIRNNFHRSKCMLHTWYVSADTQLYCLSPLLLTTLWKNPRQGKKLLALGLFLGWFIPFTYAYVWEIPCPITPFVLLENKKKLQSGHLYRSTETRFAPWIMGIWLGYIMHRIKTGQLTIKMNKRVVAVLWFYVFIVAIGCAVSLHPYMVTKHVYRRFVDSFYNSTIRILWTSAVALTIIACTTGYGGPFNNMLSHRWWAPWSRLTYAIYLIHPTILKVTTAQMRVPQNFSQVIVLRAVLSVLMLSAAAAILLNLMFESPVSAFEKILMRKPNKHTALKSSTGESEDVEKKRRMQKGYIRLPISESNSQYH
ncbi:nose resistant to fluoxetine protein 6 [Anabrus simplex]|uniref:nose resistant to fluoxetine protein 6 n=1 Tax=Anabrus simplex TaxID=316456 RepID=UPI0035A27EC0